VDFLLLQRLKVREIAQKMPEPPVGMSWRILLSRRYLTVALYSSWRKKQVETSMYRNQAKEEGLETSAIYLAYKVLQLSEIVDARELEADAEVLRKLEVRVVIEKNKSKK